MKTQFKALPEELKPREKLKRYGASRLGNDELLAILLQSGSREQNVLELARAILSLSDGISNLGELTLQKLEEIKGMGLGKASIILSAVELSRRLNQKPIKNKVMTDLDDVVAVFLSLLSTTTQESFLVMYLDKNYGLIFSEELYRGGDSKVFASPREVYSRALKHSARALIIAHTHPSGSLSPSTSDLALTTKYIEGARLLDLTLVDHLIIAPDGTYLSLRSQEKERFTQIFQDE